MLGIASGLSPFGLTIAVPLLAMMATRFNTDMGVTQFTLSAYLLGLAVAQPFNGFLCDRFGRRRVMLTGFAVFSLASIAVAFAGSMEFLILFRFLQAAGVSVGTVVSRAVVRDTRDARGSAEALSYIAAITGFAPIIAPVLGGWLASEGGHTAVFLSTAMFGTVIWILMYFRLDETLDPRFTSANWSDWVRNYKTLLGSRDFLAYSLIFGFVQGSFFAFLAVGAAVFASDFGIDERGFGIIWGLLAITYVAGAVSGGRLTGKLGSTKVINIAVVLNLISGWAMTLMVVWFGVNLAGFLASMAFLMAAAGTISPGALAGAVNAHPKMAGTAGGLSSAIGIVVGGLFTVLAGFMYHGDFLSASWLITAATTLTAGSWLLRRFHSS